MEKPVQPDFATVKEVFDWRDKQRKRHRVMTAGEYELWARTGDFYDSPTNANCFQGGLTIIFDGRPPVYGGFEDR